MRVELYSMDPMLLILLAVFVVLIFVTFRNNKKRQREAQQTQDKAVVGAQVMTSFGLFGTIRDIDEANNTVTLESTPGTFVRVHRQTITKIETSPVDDSPAAAVTSDSTPAAEPLTDEDGSPKYGLRSDEDSNPEWTNPNPSADASSQNDDKPKNN
ncbi:preprotein translocase subunit YajC [Pseudoclavibacter sp. CFCC 14310]|nr:preprotein translocase subunit YajC [Pseudoclavibacter sp. CFCC 14310]KAB1663404.1 preprotein translocase subunit YajC [Pseudoclavibacter sp. CFCC 13611]